MAIKIQWLGHSCFRVECEDYSIVVDPFEPGSVPGYMPIDETADEVLCTHEHGDHGCRAAVKLTAGEKKSPFAVTALPSYHDDKKGELRGENIIYVLEAGGVRIAHFGDVGCMPEAEVLAKLQNLDAVLIPVGGYYTVDAEEAKAIVDAISPRVTVPMHYRNGELGMDVISTINGYLDICGRWVQYDTDTLEITQGMSKHTAVLKYLGK